MLCFAGSLKVFVAVEPCDMRKGFNGLHALARERLQDRSLPSPGLLAHVLVSKYCDHFPLYRQENIFARRHGVNLPRQTLARWMELAADWLQPVYRQTKSSVMSGGYVQVDETPIDYLDPGRGKRGSRLSPLDLRLRARRRRLPLGKTSRAAACLGNVLPVDCTVTVQRDVYAAYPSLAKQHPQPIVLAGGWAHVQRKFHEARERAPRLSGWFLRQTHHIYQGEVALRETKSGP